MAIRAEQVQNGEILKELTITTLEGGKKVLTFNGSTTLSDSYTKAEVDALFTQHSKDVDWKEAVATENDIVTTYGDAENAGTDGELPQAGWTVAVKNFNSTGKSATFRFTGATWERITLLPTDIGPVTSEANGYMTPALLAKLNAIEEEANKYIHPATHDAAMITEDATHRFVTDTEKTTWNGKTTLAEAETSANLIARQKSAARTFKTEKIAFAAITNGTAIVLTETPVATDPIKVLVNGVVYTAANGDFTVAPATKTVTWTGSFALAATDDIVVEYFYDNSASVTV